MQLINGIGLDDNLNGDNGDKSKASSDLELLDAYSRAVISVVDTVGPSVVSVSVGRTNQKRGPEPTGTGAGSGVVIAPDGYILTDDHVIEKAGSITLRLTDGTSLSVSMVGKDPASDLAVIRDKQSKKLTIVPTEAGT